MQGSSEDRGQVDSVGEKTIAQTESDCQRLSSGCEERESVPEYQLEQQHSQEASEASVCGSEMELCEADRDCQSSLQVESEHVQNSPPPERAAATVLSHTEQHTSEPCWYCLASLPSKENKLPQLQLESKPLTPPRNGQHLSYQQDPRPHFGVAHSSRSTPFPLWGSRGPRGIKRMEEQDMDAVSSCPHCHLGLPLDTLRWHEAKCLLFEGQKNTVNNC